MAAGRTVRVLLGAAAASTIAAGAGAAVAWRTIATFRASPWGSEQEKVVDIPRGATLASAVRALARAGVLSDERVALWWVRWGRREHGTVKAGQYTFRGALTPDEVLERLLRGTVRTYRFTIPEGARADEIAAIIERSGAATAAELLPLFRDERLAWKLGIPAVSLEGFLFPDTYTFVGRPEPRAIVETMVRRYHRAWSAVEGDRPRSMELGEVQLVALASIVEKETGNPSERPRVACVLHNRLRRGMRLQADPTVMYATLLRTGRWSSNITRADLRAASPYNTYTRTGLPPGPIASPGEASLRAAVRPAECEDLYFVARNDGTHAFCRDLECHDAEVHRWQAP